VTRPDSPHDDSETSGLTAADESPARRVEILRERARGMFTARLTDEQIDRAIMYSDADVRLEIWRYVLEFRAASQQVPVHSSDRTDVTADDVVAERARRIAAGEPAGYKALARHFKTSPTTIRRRLGRINNK
jgi:hypothetical protein